MKIGIRREDKSRWEARVPLVPDVVRRLIRDQAVEFQVQSSTIRAFPDDAFREAGARVVEDLADCPVILGVKEIPVERLEAGKTYVYFAHVIKGQPVNMPALRRLMELGCQLIDYEKITDDKNRRLVFFGDFAGQAGMIDTLWTLGRRLDHEGVKNPFSRVRQAHEYDDLAHAQREIAAVGESIRRDGLPEALRPLVCGFAGYGAVSRGAQRIYDLLPVEEIRPEDLAAVPASDRATPGSDGVVAASDRAVFKVVFREEHMVERIDASAPFELQEYYKQPERYRAAFFPHVRHLTLLMNCIYWETKYPRLITREQFGELYADPAGARLRVIGDITCDIDGSLACTTRATEPGNPVYVYDPATGQTRDGVAGTGPVVLAVDFLPCELPVDASNYFSASLAPFIPGLARADFAGELAASGLPAELQRATIVYRGELTPPYRYLEAHVK
ncbi:MAG TPA: bifunctional lysine ketoglutarate reductase /saccharopine dehydrogenase family protein [Phycisphaerae bacterium]|nr:bifunctional lysine ketoglutarate reductase /saccharopine dehydrogenase family protein [Phycisphaerae bacterium]